MKKAKKWAAYYWYDRLGKWIKFYECDDKEKCEQYADMQRVLGEDVKVEDV